MSDTSLINNITYELEDLKQYIISEVGVNCYVGMRDHGSSDYPMIEMSIQDDIEQFHQNGKLNFVNIPVNLKIISARKEEIETLETYEKLIKYINLYKRHKGHQFTESSTAEYTENTYEITVTYYMKIKIQNETL